MARHLNLFNQCALAIVVCTAGLCSSLAGVAQSSALHQRITAQIDNSQRTTLARSRSPRALAANDVGAVPADMPLQGASLVLSRTPAQQTALDQLAAAQQNPASPLYHHWLTPEQYAAQFGVADADISTVETWLEQQGFAVDSVARSRNRISFSGTAAQVATAFGAPLHYYKAPGESTSHFAPSGDLSIPAALGAVVQGVGNLSSFRPHPQMVKPTTQPMFTVGGNQRAFLTPPDVAIIYDVKPEYEGGYNGVGQTIAVVGQSAVVAQDLVNFQTALGVPVKAQSLYLIPGTGDSAIVSGDEAEADLDLEYSSAMAPGATVAFYYVGNSGTSNAFDAINYVVDNNLASIISVSFAACEPDAGSAYISFIDAFLEQAAVQGQTVVVAAGDYGVVSCMQGSFSEPTAIQDAPAVEYPASSPWVVAMGGTQFPQADLGTDTGLGSVNSTYWGPAPDEDAVDTALSYIPEQIWDDTNEGGPGSGGGGTSIYEPQPLWQTGVPGIPDGNFRLVPDISLAASDIAPGYLICSSDTEFTNITGSCANGFRDAPGNSFNMIGGTSVATPIFAGLVAVLNQAKGYTTTGQGLINPTLYTLASNSSTYASAFHDITVGNNACIPVDVCGAGPQNTDYFAGVGYDEASGLGSIDFANLVLAWPDAPEGGLASTTTTLTASSTSPVYGASVTITATVSASGSPATSGVVTFMSNGSSIGTGTIDDGVATITLSTLPGGADSVTASYAGTANFAASASNAIAVTVAQAPTTTTLTASSTSPAYGSSVTFSATVSASGSPATSGVVTFLSNGSSIGTGTVSSGGGATITLSTLPSGADSVTASYAGTSSFAASASSAVLVTVSAAPTTTTLAASSTSPAFGTSVTLTAAVSASGSPATSGVVTFLNGGSSIGTGTVNSSGVATVSLSTLPSGADSITASYAGTSSFAASASNAVLVMVSAAPTTTTLTASSTSPAFCSSVTLTATVSASGSPATAGVVTFLSGGSSIGTGTVNSSGVAMINVSNLPSGSDSITASYGGTSNLAASASEAVTVTVAPDTTTTVLSSSSISSAYGASVAFTAMVSIGGSPATSGVVTFLNGGSSIGTGTVNSGVATISLSTLSVGTDSITASFGGTSNLAASSSSAVMVTVAPDTTTTVLSSSTTNPTFGASVAFTAAVSIGGSPATSGVVTFLNGGAAIGTGAVNDGVATLNLTTLPSGSNSITAAYGGTSNFAASSSNAVTVTVAPATTTTTLSASPMSATYGSTVTFTATVSSSLGSATSGVVTFQDDGSLIGTGAVNNGVSSLTLTTLPTGSNSITADYGGPSSLSSSVSNAVTVSVALATTTTTLSASSANAVYGASVVLTATVSNGGSPATSGVVMFLNDGSLIGTGAVINGVATLNLTTLPTGANSITASFGGTSSLAASASSTVLVTVTMPQVGTATTLSSSSTSPSPGDSVMFTATVTSNGTAVTSGTVTFLNGSSSIGMGTVYNGVALMSLTTLPTGTDSITASYGGTSNLAASASSAVIVTVAVPVGTVPPASITVSTPAPVVAGGVVTATASLSAGGSYAGTMTLTCRLTGSPAGAQSVPTCSLNPATLTLVANGVGTAVLAVQTTAATTTQARTSGLNLWGLGGGSALAGLLMFCIPSRRRRLLSMLAMLIVVASVGSIGCGGGGAADVTPPPTTTPATTPGAYSFTISGADALNPTITTSAVVSVTVE